MGWLDRLFGVRGGWDGTAGRPPSGNGASSLHLIWSTPPGDWRSVEAVLEVIEPPTVNALHFWALQVTFAGARGECGGAHLGLQWFDRHPGSTAVNWGGYATGGEELTGTTSALPSAAGNVNTRDYAWEPGRPYLLRVAHGGDAPGGIAWCGSVTDLETGVETVVRDLWAPGARLAAPMVWSEVFAACDDPGSAVRWSGLVVEDGEGQRYELGEVRVNYQSLGDGGCATTTSELGDRWGSFVQRTGTARTTPQGATLRW